MDMMLQTLQAVVVTEIFLKGNSAFFSSHFSLLINQRFAVAEADECYGVCGPSCTCWPAVCGDFGYQLAALNVTLVAAQATPCSIVS